MSHIKSNYIAIAGSLCMRMKNWIINCNGFFCCFARAFVSSAKSLVRTPIFISQAFRRHVRFKFARSCAARNSNFTMVLALITARLIFFSRVLEVTRMHNELSSSCLACLPWALSVRCENMRTSRQTTNATRINRGGSCKDRWKKCTLINRL